MVYDRVTINHRNLTHVADTPNYTSALAPYFIAGSETLREFLERRQRELSQQVSALRGQISPMERELLEIKMALEALPPPPPDLSGLGVAVAGPTGGVAGMFDTLAEVGRRSAGVAGNALQGPTGPTGPPAYWAMTIKQLVVQAFLDHFKDGASPAEIRDFISNAYGRSIEAASLRPQMHRLKAAGVLEQSSNALQDKWMLTKKHRHLYTMYDHPTSRASMKELQDDPDAME